MVWISSPPFCPHPHTSPVKISYQYPNLNLCQSFECNKFDVSRLIFREFFYELKLNAVIIDVTIACVSIVLIAVENFLEHFSNRLFL